MTESFEKINYSLRPAKSIERKMMCEAFRRLSAFGKVDLYSYIGFGSTYFSDFSLFHKTLNIQNMTSIEKSTDKQERFKFNTPFRCVQMKFGTSTEILPSLNENSRKIIWLDYDGMLSSDVLLDIKTSCSKVQSGSIIIVSVNANPISNGTIDIEDLPDFRLNRLISAVGKNKVPAGTKGKDFAKWGTAKVCREIINNEISSTITDINGAREDGSKLCYEQLFNFHYSDNAKMLTVGGVIYDEGQAHLLSQCSFDDLPFITKENTPYHIEVPNLTFKEIRALDEQLPKKDGETLALPSVSQEDIEKYEKIYRFFPTFTEANL